MNKKTLSLIIVLSLALNNCSVALANTPEETIKKSKETFQQLDSKIMDLNAQISNLNNDINKLNSQLSENKTNIQNTEKQIKDTEHEILDVEKKVEKNETILGKRMRALYKNGQASSPLAVIISSENMSDFITKLTAVTKIVTLDKEVIKDLDDQKNTLKSAQNNLNTKKENLEKLQKSTESDLKNLNEKQNEQKSTLIKLNEEKEKVASVIEENENLLVAHSISVIDSSNSSKVDIENAVSSLKGLLPQLNSSTVKSKVNSAINNGTSKLEAMNVPKVPNFSNTAPSNGSYKATYTMEATAYSGHTITATGLKPIRDPNGISTIAVDPSVIPLGSKVYIPGYGYAIASDTGGAIKGMKIDLFMNSESECYSFGRRNVTLHIVAYPNQW
ncbi:3D domain-containing protein [Clostridium tarantellae]|uniref:Uncharacterized protein n=1 Tax=Clostridium tarantellae TaxID=39493 RepID=A0A6I1MP41_9CLOT|nr:3D domain-containing protein [Clostridium tarantellae]MPQ43992.1 hypothetical protein [Clostridium tarantellae]